MRRAIIVFLILALLSIYNGLKAHASECTVQCPITQDNVWGYYQADKFQWTDKDKQVHMLIGFSGTLIISELLTHYVHLKPWQSALIGTVFMGLVGTTKEVFFDTYTMRSDIQSWWGGAAAGGLTFTVIHF